MAELKYKTRGMTEPGKKEKVYFCCHPDEFSYFFDGISDEILKRQNCAIWYRDERDPYNEEEHLSDLSRMQLFVMPITTKLLNTRNRALDVDFRFAVENHIPVLPLMQESGLDRLFNEKCGDLQYLDKFNRDETAISYEEKLTKFLEGVLIGDELAEKIRNAFDAYVFLSYRKKDRKYAQELMRLIHKNDFCRDIAIWYDEFLTPGENFNDSIKEALEKSGLFVLTVTPNLVNEENYIMTTEYPMARKEKKPVLPALLVPTDKALLSEKYEDIPECTDAHNSIALSDALLAAVQKMAIKENDNSPEHNFFIGLAYLSGIDVEVDHERARKLIGSSAEAGLLEAQKKLVSMYMSGDGVERSFEKAAKWNKRVAEAYGEIFKAEPCFENLDTWLSSYISIAGKYSIANDTYSQLDQYMYLTDLCDQIAELTADDKQLDNTRLRYKALGYIYASNCYKNLGNLENTVECPKKALAILEPLYKEDFKLGSAWIEKDYATCLAFVGETYRLTNDINTALLYFTKATDIKRELRERYKFTGNIDFETEYAMSLANLAGVHLLNYENLRAAEYYKEALSVLDAAEEEHGNFQTVPLYVDIALSYSTVYRAAGEFGMLEEILEDVIDKIKDYNDSTGVKLYYSLLRSAVFLGQAYLMQKKIAPAEEKLLLCVDINREYLSMCRRDIDLSMMCSCYSFLANVELEREDIPKAKVYAASAVEYADKCLGEGFDLSAADCSAAYSLYSTLEIMSDNVDRGMELLKRAITILEEKSYSIDDTRAIPMFFVAYLNYATISFERGDFHSTIEYGTKCIDSFERYRVLAPGIANNSGTAFISYCVGQAKYSLDKKEGRDFLIKMAQCYEKHMNEEGVIHDYDGYATVCIALSAVAGVFERSKWKKKAIEAVGFMEDNFGAAFEKTVVYALLNG